MAGDPRAAATIREASLASGSAGPRALPHFHQRSRVPPGHTFYETPNLRARK
jgi:hypothetical protein